MSKTIEELEKERDEILAKVEELDRLTSNLEAVQWPEVSRVLEELRAHRPKPNLIDGWLNVNSERYTGSKIWPTEADARINAPMPCRQVHIREVTPAPKWERWEAVLNGVYWELRGFDGVMTTFMNGSNAQNVAAAHNAEMERMTALWEGGAE